MARQPSTHQCLALPCSRLAISTVGSSPVSISSSYWARGPAKLPVKAGAACEQLRSSIWNHHPMASLQGLCPAARAWSAVCAHEAVRGYDDLPGAKTHAQVWLRLLLPVSMPTPTPSFPVPAGYAFLEDPRCLQSAGQIVRENNSKLHKARKQDEAAGIPWRHCLEPWKL